MSLARKCKEMGRWKQEGKSLRRRLGVEPRERLGKEPSGRRAASQQDRYACTPERWPHVHQTYTTGRFLSFLRFLRHHGINNLLIPRCAMTYYVCRSSGIRCLAAGNPDCIVCYGAVIRRICCMAPGCHVPSRYPSLGSGCHPCCCRIGHH